MRSPRDCPFPQMRPLDGHIYSVEFEWEGAWMVYKAYPSLGYAKNAVLCHSERVPKPHKKWHNGRCRDVQTRIVETKGGRQVIIWQGMLSTAERGKW